MFDGVLSWLFDAAKYVFAEKNVPGRGEGRLWGGFPNYNIYETKDGKYITVGSLETKFEKKLLKKLGMDDLAAEEEGITSSRLKASDQALHDFFRDTFLTRTRDEWMKELEELNVCVGPVNTLEEALSHPQAISRKMVVDVDHPSVGVIKQIGSALKLSDVSIDPNRNPAPRLGQHTREVLKRLGYDEGQIDDLVKRKIARET
jgi:crotonobetainyl-CoA:carnitine CoA-transferase CaiB-like acyl-CoA transferase